MDGDVLTDDEDLDGEPLAGASGLGPDLRLLPQSELQNLCRQAGLPTDGVRLDSIRWPLSCSWAAQVRGMRCLTGLSQLILKVSRKGKRRVNVNDIANHET